MELLNSPTFKRLEKAISAAELRQQALSNNLANVDTPFFKRSDVLFESLLEQSLGNNNQPQLDLRRTDSRHMRLGNQSFDVAQPKIVTDESSVMNNNLNNVDVDREMSQLALNQLRYYAFIQQATHNVKMMRIGIEGRV